MVEMERSLKPNNAPGAVPWGTAAPLRFCPCETAAQGSEPPSQAAWPSAPQTIMHRADIKPAAAITGAIVAAIEPFRAKARALAAIKGMPDRKNRRCLSGLQVQEACLRFRRVRRQRKEQNEKGNGAKDYHGRLPETSPALEQPARVLLDADTLLQHFRTDQLIRL